MARFVGARWRIYGALAGLRIEILPIENAPPDDPHCRLYVAPCIQGLDRDRAASTGATRPAPTGWAAVYERQSMTRQLAAISMRAPFYDDELQRDFGFDPPEDEL